MEIPILIYDLAIILLTAGVIAVIFKKIKQPVVLGYILAGFLVSQYFPWFGTVAYISDIEVWSEIGIIFLMFHIGLEFDLHKLADIGVKAIITGITNLAGMGALGISIGSFLGMGMLPSATLGCMLAMSSTMVVIKLMEEMQVDKATAQSAAGCLVIQDIIGIFSMVVISTLAVSKGLSAGDIAIKLSLMILYLGLWIILGIIILPSALKKTIKYMNDEMLLIVSLGVCFGMVLLAHQLGFSSALGAFISGSLFAGTIHAKRIEKLTIGVRDLFGAVFFVSVGMMVNPKVITEYWLPIVIIIIAVILVKPLVNAAGMLLAGSNIHSALKVGFTLSQIGEFAFIIASLGIESGIMDKYLYPMTVSAAVATIFLTPVFMKNSDAITEKITGFMPARILARLDTDGNSMNKDQHGEWGKYIKRYFGRIFLFGSIIVLIAVLGVRYLHPALADIMPGTPAAIITIAAISAVMAVNIKPYLDRHSDIFTSLWLDNKRNRIPLIFFAVLRFAVLIAICVITVRMFFNINILILAILAAVVIYFVIRGGRAASLYLQIETGFLSNFNEKIKANEKKDSEGSAWLDDELKIISFITPQNAAFAGKTLKKLNWNRYFNLYVVKVKRKGSGHQILMPGKSFAIHEGDKVYLVGFETAINNFYKMFGVETNGKIRTLKEFMNTDYADVRHALAMCAVKVKGNEDFANRRIREGHLIQKHRVAIFGIRKKGHNIFMPDADYIINKDDILWVMGSNTDVGLLVSDYME